MATTIAALAKRTLEKLRVLGAGETASASDQEKAEEGLRAALYGLARDDLLRFTSSDIPFGAEQPLVSMAAFLIAADFGATPAPAEWLWARNEISKMANLKARGTVRADFF